MTLGENDRQEIKRMYLGGIPVRIISKNFNLSREGVYRYLRDIPNFKEISETLRRAKKLRQINQYHTKLDEVYRLARGGKHTVEISKMLKIPYTELKKILKGTKYDNTHISKTKRNAKIIKMYKQGVSQQKIAKKFGLAQSTISDVVKNGKL